MGTGLAPNLKSDPPSLKKRAHAILVDHVNFSETPLCDALTDLSGLWTELTGPKSKGENEMNFILQISGEKSKTLKVTLNLTKMPYDEVVRYVTESVGLKCRVEDYAFFIYAPTQSNGK
jgi:hypothetical protein